MAANGYEPAAIRFLQCAATLDGHDGKLDATAFSHTQGPSQLDSRQLRSSHGPTVKAERSTADMHTSSLPSTQTQVWRPYRLANRAYFGQVAVQRSGVGPKNGKNAWKWIGCTLLGWLALCMRRTLQHSATQVQGERRRARLQARGSAMLLMAHRSTSLMLRVECHLWM